jgi:hypothetical protein
VPNSYSNTTRKLSIQSRLEQQKVLDGLWNSRKKKTFFRRKIDPGMRVPQKQQKTDRIFRD